MTEVIGVITGIVARGKPGSGRSCRHATIFMVSYGCASAWDNKTRLPSLEISLRLKLPVKACREHRILHGAVDRSECYSEYRRGSEVAKGNGLGTMGNCDSFVTVYEMDLPLDHGETVAS